MSSFLGSNNNQNNAGEGTARKQTTLSLFVFVVCFDKATLGSFYLTREIGSRLVYTIRH